MYHTLEHDAIVFARTREAGGTIAATLRVPQRAFTARETKSAAAAEERDYRRQPSQ